MRRARLWLIGSCLLLATGCGWKTQPRETHTADEPGKPEVAPAFSLANDDGTFVSLDELLVDGPAVLVFYRGHW